MLTFPDHHPLYQVIQNTRQTLPTKHLSLINSLLKCFNLDNTKVETISPAASIRCPPAKYSTMIAPSREDSIDFEKWDKANYKIFSDGSGHENGIGSAAILYKKGRSSKLKTLQAYIGTLKQAQYLWSQSHKSNPGDMDLTQHPTVGKTISLYTDNQQ